MANDDDDIARGAMREALLRFSALSAGISAALLPANAALEEPSDDLSALLDQIASRRDPQSR